MTGRLLPFRAKRAQPQKEGKDPFARLVDKTREGDAAATRTLIVSLMPNFLRAARGVLGAHHRDVEDVTQEAALGLLRALPTFQMQCTVAHFATRIGVHTALSARRRLKVRGEGQHVELDETHATSGLSPADVLLSGYRRQMLRELCDELPEAQSEALVLHCVMGMSLEEVAAATATPRNTIRSRLRLAKESLRARIAGDSQLRDALGREGIR